ncbi:islet cell autoantigen 1-like [Lates japonicus]
MLGASRCNMLSHSLCTYQTTLLQFWEKTAHTMSGIHEAFQGHIPYQFTTLKDLRDPLEEITDSQKQVDKKEKALPSNADSLVSLDDDKTSGSASDADPALSSDGPSQNSDHAHQKATTPTPALHDLRGLSVGSDEDLMLMACDLPPQPQLPAPTNIPLQPQLLPPPPQAGDWPEENVPWGFGSLQSSLSQLPATGDGLLSGGPPHPAGTVLRPEEEDSERGDMAFLKDLLSPGPGASDEFSKEWQDAFGMFDPPKAPPAATGAASGGQAACMPSNPPSPTGFLPSQLLDHSLSATGWSTPPMFQAPPLQPPPGQNQSAQMAPSSAANAAPGGSKDMSAWFNLFADLDPLSNPDAIGRSADELLNA